METDSSALTKSDVCHQVSLTFVDILSQCLHLSNKQITLHNKIPKQKLFRNLACFQIKCSFLPWHYVWVTRHINLIVHFNWQCKLASIMFCTLLCRPMERSNSCLHEHRLSREHHFVGQEQPEGSRSQFRGRRSGLLFLRSRKRFARGCSGQVFLI